MAKKAKRGETFEFHGFAKRTHERCEDCDIRGDLSTTGKPVVWVRICRCASCQGRGELPLRGLEQLDPYAKKPFLLGKYMVYKPWDVECRSNANAASSARFDAIAEIMSTPPGGHNNGRMKTQEGAWVPLETEGCSPPSHKRALAPRTRELQRAHGHAWRYMNGCRCSECRGWQAARMKRYRATYVSRGSTRSEKPLGTPERKPNAEQGEQPLAA